MDKDNEIKKKLQRHTVPYKRGQSLSPVLNKPRSSSDDIAELMMMGDTTPQNMNFKPKLETERRCQSLSPSNRSSKKSLNDPAHPQRSASAQEPLNHNSTYSNNNSQEFEVALPQNMVTKLMRTLATKKREFFKMRKHFFSQQNSLLEHFATLKDLEARVGMTGDDSLGDIRLVTLSKWPAHDILMLVRDDLQQLKTTEINGVFGPQVIQQLNAQLNIIPEEVVALGAELMARRLAIMNILRNRHRTDRASYQANLEWKAKNAELDNETEQLHVMIASTAENLRAKINYAMDLAKTPWLDRDTLIKKLDHSQRELLILQQKLEEATKKDKDDKDSKDTPPPPSDGTIANQTLLEELNKERAARENLKEVVSGAESMLRVARARIATLERGLKESRAELETFRRKHRDLEQLYRHRETSYDARSRKLLEVSKNGEVTIEALSKQRDALELRVKELREHAESTEKNVETRELELKARADSLQAKVAEQEKARIASEKQVIVLETRIREVEENLRCVKEKSMRLVDAQRRHCVDLIPTKESEPSDRETELWKELQVTRVALSRAEEELRQSRADKDSFLNSLSRLAQEGADRIEDKMALELLDKEQKVVKLQNIIEEQRENEKLMEQSMTQYENQLADLRLEVKRLRNYDCYNKEVVYQDLQTELLELHMKVATLTRERSALVSAAASRALMLERHERSADLFARITRLRRELGSFVEARPDPPPIEESSLNEVSRSLSAICASAADTWTALRVERARVLRLERAVLAQSLQLEREGRVRTQLERRRTMLEREVARSGHAISSDTAVLNSPSIVSMILTLNRQKKSLV